MLNGNTLGKTVNVLKDMNDDDISKCEFENCFTIYLFILFIYFMFSLFKVDFS